MPESEPSRLIPPDHGVALRLYRQGFGDCFLIAFKGAMGEPRYILIDCGVLIAKTKESSAPEDEEDKKAWAAAETKRKNEANRLKIKDIVKDIHVACGGKLDVLAITHEHWDHISSFQQAREEWHLFEGDAIGEIWMAWTEDPRDSYAVSLNARLRAMVKALKSTSLRLASVDSGQADQINNLLDFSWDGVDESAQGMVTAENSNQVVSTGEPSFGVSTAQSLQLLEALGRPIRYWGPDKPPLELFRSPRQSGGLRVYFLGPPRDTVALGMEDSSLTGELYPRAPELTVDTAFLAAALFREGANALGVSRLLGVEEEIFHTLRDESQPFAHHFNMLEWEAEGEVKPSIYVHSHIQEQANLAKRFREKYYGPLPENSNHPNAWRHIATDWLGAATDLALKLDNATNNTSLVLALEFIDAAGEKKILLFPGDAQFGSWNSWFDHEWKDSINDENVSSSAITIADIFARTVFYKVSHHGSHNATLMRRGLERMNHSDLVAFVPVSEEASRDNGWMHIPLPSLMERLAVRARGRVLRADREFPLSGTGDGEWAPRPAALTAKEWNDFTNQVKVCPLYFDCIIT